MWRNGHQILIVCLLLCRGATGEAQGGVGAWRTHFSYESLRSVEEAGDAVFALSQSSLFSYTPKDGRVEPYSRLTGLTDRPISLIRYGEATKTVVVVYSNSNIDLLTSTNIYNISDLYLKPIAGSKQINDIFFFGEDAYLAADCGVVVLNVTRREIAETYDLGIPIASCCVTPTHIYAYTVQGIWAGNRATNLLDKTNWNRMNDLSASRGMVFNSVALAWVAGVGLFRLDPQLDEWVKQNGHGGTIGQKSYSDKFIEFTPNQLFIYRSLEDNPVVVAFDDPIADVSYRHADKSFWAVSPRRALCNYRLSTDETLLSTVVEQVKPNSPASDHIYTGLFDRGRLYFLTSGPQFVAEHTPAQVMRLDDSHTWSNLSQPDVSAEAECPFDDALSMALDPADADHYFVSTWSRGVFEFRGNRFVGRHHRGNSPIESIYGNDQYQWVNGLAFDRGRNLWMLNSGVRDAVKVLKADGKWGSLFFQSITKTESLDRLLILRHTDGEPKWAISRRDNPGLFVFDDRGTIDIPSDDRSRFFNTFVDQDNKTIASSELQCMVEDRAGVVWMGTDRGLILFASPGEAFSPAFHCTRIKVPRNDGTNLADYLLENERITCITVDGANRKWIGTAKSGLYLVSPDGLETIHHFTADNSPLPSNELLSLVLHPHTGDLFASTSLGMVSYRSEAIDPKETFENVYAFPNPVRPTYTGLITVTGLMENSTVKIINSAGQLVFNERSQGGQVTWDGLDDSGQRVASGVYPVFCSTELGEERVATKIVIVK